MKLIAHRGYKLNSKENTIESFNNAYNDSSFFGIELDVRKTLDNKLVVLHDFFINRVSDGYGFINKLTYKDILKYNFNTKKNKEKILLLKDVIKKYNKKIILIEIKDSSINLNEIKDIINKNNIYVMSFNKKHIYSFLDSNKKYKLGYLNYGNYDKSDLNLDFIVLNKYLITDKIIEFYKKHNIEIFVWGLFKKNKVLFSDFEYPYFIVDNKNISFQTK